MTAPPAHAFDQVWTVDRLPNGVMKPLRTDGGQRLHMYCSDPEIIDDTTLFFSAGEAKWAPGPSIYAMVNGGPTFPVLKPNVGVAEAWDNEAHETFAGCWIPAGFRGGPAGYLGFTSSGDGWSTGKRRHIYRWWWPEGRAWANPVKPDPGPVMGPERWFEQGTRKLNQQTGKWYEDVQVGEQSVVVVGEVLHMIYAATGPVGAGFDWSICYAASLNSGETWTKHPNPVLYPPAGMNMASHPCVRVDPRGGFQMWCTISGNVGRTKKGICSYWSADLINWTPNPRNPLIYADDAGWVGMPSVKLSGDKWDMVFGGQTASDQRELWTARASFNA